MHVRYRMTALAAATAGGLALAGLTGAAPVLAKPIPMPMHVPCSPDALSSAISGAADGDVLYLATNCTYLLTNALPDVAVPLTIYGFNSTIERSSDVGTPDFSLLTLASGGSLAVDDVNFANGAASAYGGGIDAEYGPVSVTGGTFTGNYFAHLSDSKVFSNHAPSGGGGGIYDDDSTADTVTLTNTNVVINTVNNCSPAASVPGCIG
jgi:hypothetical protein